MAKIEQYKQLGIKIDICNCILSKKSWFRIFHDEEYVPTLYIVDEKGSQKLARGIEDIDRYLADYLEARLVHDNDIENFLTGRIF